MTDLLGCMQFGVMSDSKCIDIVKKNIIIGVKVPYQIALYFCKNVIFKYFSLCSQCLLV